MVWEAVRISMGHPAMKGSYPMAGTRCRSQRVRMHDNLFSGDRPMSEAIDTLIHKGLQLEEQIAQLTAELSQVREAIAARLGERREYYGQGVLARKWARVRWHINKELLLDELPREALDYLKEVVFTKEKLRQAVQAGYLPPRLHDRAVKQEREGWNVSFRRLEAPPAAWEDEVDEA